MKKLVFNQNDFLVKNNFSNVLKREIHSMVFDYFNNKYIVPQSFEKFDKEISDLVIRLLDEQDDLKKKRRINSYKKDTSTTYKKKINKKRSFNRKKVYLNKTIKNSPSKIHTTYINKNARSSPIKFKKFIK